jgi:hypothetical protein
MNEILADLYGTQETIQGAPSEEDLQKQASAEFLCKLAAQEGVDLETLSDEQVVELLNEVEGMNKEAGAQPDEQVDEEAQTKLAEADFLGRAMAHAYVAELSEIEKQAAGKGQAAYQAIKGAVGKALGSAGEATGVSQIKKGLKGIGAAKAMQKAEVGAGAAKRGLKAFPSGKAGVEELKAGVKRLGKRVALPGVGVAGVGYGAKKLMDKKSFNQQIEDAATDRAYEMLAEAGYDVEKQAAADVDVRALQMLEEAGYEVNWS